jgi:hypothetical protein
MAFSQHTVMGAGLAAIVALAIIAGLAVTGGPGEARKQREDAARRNALSETALALACYYKSEGTIPVNMSDVEAVLSGGVPGEDWPRRCSQAEIRTDPVSGEPFRLMRTDGDVTQICAVFAAADRDAADLRHTPRDAVLPDIRRSRSEPGEHCYRLNFAADLD